MAKALLIWYVALPALQYTEDIKGLAKEAGLKIVDAKYQGDADQCENPPKLTLKVDKEPQLEAALDQLKAEADKVGVEYGASIGFDTLFKRVEAAKGG